MSLSEQCGCGAQIDTVPGLPFRQAAAFAAEWRKTHRHNGTKPQAPMGFPLPSAVSTTYVDGEDADSFDDE